MDYITEKLNGLSKGLLNWYCFKPHSRVIQIASEKDALTELLMEQQLFVVVKTTQSILAEELCEEDKVDYVIWGSGFEKCEKPLEVLGACKKLLKQNGTLLLATDNRMGIRYFCGDRDPFTGRNFDGVEGYRRSLASDGARDGRCYSQSEIEFFLDVSGFTNRRFYAVLPDVEHPQLIFAEDYVPAEDLSMRYFPLYNSPETVFLEEEFLYNDLIANGLFHKMANSYFIECTDLDQMSNVNQVTLSLERDKKDAFLTIIRRDGKVEKRAVYSEGKERLKKLIEHQTDLIGHGLHMVEAEYTNGRYIMPFVDASLGAVHLKNLARVDKEAFVSKMDQFRDLILKSSDIVKKNEEDGLILKRGYFDLVPLNSFWVNENFVFYDQEFYVENYPANVIITRLVDLVYQGDFELEGILPRDFFLERYGLKKNIEKWRRMVREFLKELRNETDLRVFHEKHRRNMEDIHTNRQRMNYSESEYQRLFVDIFEGLDRKKLILFGSGNFSAKFMTLYGKEYPIHGVLDNNESKWGTLFHGVEIMPPSMLHDLNPDEYKVIICIKNYLAVMKQLKQIGAKNIAIYDTNKEYVRKKKPIETKTIEESVEKKKYGVGYIAGVFDLFHVGHLNMFKRAKEQCEYLIVGVVTDEGVRKNKKTEPFIPFEERMEMVKSCRYVDEAVEIPLNYAGTRDAYRLYHFDVQFSGSDYVDNPNWLAEKEFLEKNGAEMVFFPYTEQTSSTKIKALINKQLEK